MDDWRWTRRRKRCPCHSQSPCCYNSKDIHLRTRLPMYCSSASLFTINQKHSDTFVNTQNELVNFKFNFFSSPSSAPSTVDHNKSILTPIKMACKSTKHFRCADSSTRSHSHARTNTLLLDSISFDSFRSKCFTLTFDRLQSTCRAITFSSSSSNLHNKLRITSVAQCAPSIAFIRLSIICFLLMSCILGPVQAIGALLTGASNSTDSSSSSTLSTSSTSSTPSSSSSNISIISSTSAPTYRLRTNSTTAWSKAQNSPSKSARFVFLSENEARSLPPFHSNSYRIPSRHQSHLARRHSLKHSLVAPASLSSSSSSFASNHASPTLNSLPLLQALQSSASDLNAASSSGSSRRSLNHLRPQSSTSSSFFEPNSGYNYKSLQPKVSYSNAHKHRKPLPSRTASLPIVSSTSNSMYIDSYEFTSAPTLSVLSTNLPETWYQQTLKRQNAVLNNVTLFSSIEPRVTYSGHRPTTNRTTNKNRNVPRTSSSLTSNFTSNSTATIQPPYAFTGSVAALRANKTYDKDMSSLSQNLFKPIFTITRSNGKMKNYYKNEDEDELFASIASSTVAPVRFKTNSSSSSALTFDDEDTETEPMHPVDENGQKIDLRLLWKKEFEEQAARRLSINHSQYPSSEVSLFSLLPVRSSETNDSESSTEISSSASTSSSNEQTTTPNHIQFTAGDQIDAPSQKRFPFKSKNGTTVIEAYSKLLSSNLSSQSTDSINFAKPIELLANLQYGSIGRNRSASASDISLHNSTQAKQLPAAGLKQALDRATTINTAVDSIVAASRDSIQSVTVSPQSNDSSFVLNKSLVESTKDTTTSDAFSLSPFRPIDRNSNNSNNHINVTKPTGVARPFTNQSESTKPTVDTIDGAIRAAAKVRHQPKSSIRSNSTAGRETKDTDQPIVESGEPYRLSTERLAYLLIGGCCALSLICLLVVALSLRCRDMCDEYREWKSAEKLALFNYRYAQHQQQRHRQQRLKLHELAAFGGRMMSESSGGSGSQLLGSNNRNTPPNSKPQPPNTLNAMAANNQRNHSSGQAFLSNVKSNQQSCPINLSRPIFGPSCCCCPTAMFLAKEGAAAAAAAAAVAASKSPEIASNACPRGYFHPCPRGRLPFGAASSLFARFNGNVAGPTRNQMASEMNGDEDSLVVSLNEQQHAVTGHDHDQTNEASQSCLQCTCEDSFDDQSDSTPTNAEADRVPTHSSNRNSASVAHDGYVPNTTKNVINFAHTRPHSQPPISVANNNATQSHHFHHLHHPHLHSHSHLPNTAHAHQFPAHSKLPAIQPTSNQWMHTSMLVDELHRKQMQKNAIAKQTPNRSKHTSNALSSNNERPAVFWSGNKDRLI